MALLDKISVTNLDPARLQTIATIYRKFDRYDLAIKYARQLIDLKGEEYSAFKATAHKFLSEIYEEQKQYAPALLHFKQYQLLETEQITKRMNDDAGKKIIKAEAERDLAVKQQEIEKQQFLTYFAIAIAGLVILLSALIYYFYRREQARKVELTNLNTTKDKLFAILSHDLRAPVPGQEPGELFYAH